MVRLLKVFLHVPTFSISVLGKVLHQAGSETAGMREYGNMGIQECGNILQHGGCSSCSQSQNRTRSVSRWSFHKNGTEDGRIWDGDGILLVWSFIERVHEESFQAFHCYLVSSLWLVWVSLWRLFLGLWIHFIGNKHHSLPYTILYIW